MSVMDSPQAVWWRFLCLVLWYYARFWVLFTISVPQKLFLAPLSLSSGHFNTLLLLLLLLLFLPQWSE